MTGEDLRPTLHLEEREDLHPILLQERGDLHLALHIGEREDPHLFLHQEGEDPRLALHQREREGLHLTLRLRERENRPLILHQEGKDPLSCPPEGEDPGQTQTEPGAGPAVPQGRGGGREVSRQLRRPAGWT